MRVNFSEDRVCDENYEAYEYKGYLTASGSQLHWIMNGINHKETFYAMFDRRLGKDVDKLMGICLATSNDEYQKPVAIKCLLAKECLDEEEVSDLLGAKDYMTVRS